MKLFYLYWSAATSICVHFPRIESLASPLCVEQNAKLKLKPFKLQFTIYYLTFAFNYFPLILLQVDLWCHDLSFTTKQMCLWPAFFFSFELNLNNITHLHETYHLAFDSFWVNHSHLVHFCLMNNGYCSCSCSCSIN